MPIPGVEEFADATEPGAIQYACADGEPALAALYEERGLRLNPALIRPLDQHPFCHVFYEPTLPGFRISAEQQRLEELYASVDSLSFVAGRQAIGDSTSILAAVVAALAAPPRLTINISGGFPQELWAAAAERQLPGLAKYTALQPSGGDAPHNWGQDQMKAGEVDGRVRVLVPRRLFEGRDSDGETFMALLDGLNGGRYSRSKLSWEGGDLIAIHPPNQPPSRTLLVHGLAANRYWGTPLRRDEYGWVLRTEFGADGSFDVGGLAPHADYVVSFLPSDPIALVAQPRFRDAAMAGAAAEFLGNLLGAGAPPAVRDLLVWIKAQGSQLFDDEPGLRRRIAAAREDQDLLEVSPPAELEAGLDAYMAQHCPGDPEACFLGEGKLEMFEREPDLLRRSLNSAARAKLAMEYLPRILNLIEGQIPGAVEKDPRHFDAVAASLAGIGYQVERLPYFLAAPDENMEVPWPGVSYINLLAVGRQIVLPGLGLGEVENSIARELGQKLGPGYSVTMVDARSALASNGGVHCVFGLIRRPLDVRVD